MNLEKTLSEAKQYLAYLSDALYKTSSSYKLHKLDKLALEKYSGDLFNIANSLDQILINRHARKEQERKINEEEQAKQEQKNKELGLQKELDFKKRREKYLKEQNREK